jgi:hypothetical protein
MGSKLAPLLCLCLISGNVPAVSGQKPAAAPRLAIDADRPFVYLKFVRYGPGIPFGENEPKQRIWFKFVNNCNVPITISTFGVPDGTPRDEVGVMDRVIRDEHSGIEAEFLPPMAVFQFPQECRRHHHKIKPQELDRSPRRCLLDIGSKLDHLTSFRQEWPYYSAFRRTT